MLNSAQIGMWSEKLSQMDMTELAKWTIRPRLMAVPGVANVAIWGEYERQYQVLAGQILQRRSDKIAVFDLFADVRIETWGRNTRVVRRYFDTDHVA